MALEHVDAIHRHLARGTLDEEIVIDAISIRLSAAIDVLNGGDPTLGERLFPAEWQTIKATRNVLAHAYHWVDDDRVRATVDNELPEFERVLREEFARLQGD